MPNTKVSGVLNTSMARKKSHPVDAPAAAPVYTPDQNIARALRQIDEVWQKEIETLSRTYDQCMHGAWNRYTTALKAHGPKPTAGTDFDGKYDEERESALRAWFTGSEKADEKAACAKANLYKKAPKQLRDENDDSL